MHERLALSVILAATLPLPARAQWTIGPEVGVQTFGPSARDTVAGADLGPTRVTTFGLGLARTGARTGFEVRFRYGQSGLAATNGDVTVVQERVFKLYDLASLASWRMARIGDASTLHVAAGPSLSIWKAKTGESRTRVGASAALQLRVALSAQCQFAVRAEAGVSPSVFDQADVIADAERRTFWRGGVSMEIERKL